MEGANLLLRIVVLVAVLITLSDGLVTLLTSHGTLRVEPLRGLEQLIPLLAQPSNRHGIHARPFLQGRKLLLGPQLQIPFLLNLT